MAKKKRSDPSPEPQSQRPQPAGSRPESAAAPVVTSLRIVGGTLRGRKLFYSGDERTRPMKDRVREAVFNLIGDDVVGAHAIDLFAGAGALGLEAISRGAARATFIERHFPTADLILQSIRSLDVESRCQVVPGDAFIWSRRHVDLGTEPWIVFCSPPYALYSERQEDMLALLHDFCSRAPAGSVLAVEADDRFDFDQLPPQMTWDVRHYPPAIMGIGRLTR